MSLRDELFAKAKEQKPVVYKFMDTTCFIRQWTERERAEWAVYVQSVTDVHGKNSDDLFLCQAVAKGLVDDQGKRIFVDDEDVKRLMDFPTLEIQAAFNAVIDLNTLKTDAKKN